jgi:uncharacterized protein
MALTVNLRHLERGELDLNGSLTPEELDLTFQGEVVRLSLPVTHELHVELLHNAILARGRIEAVLDCECVRCLKPFQQALVIEDWVCHLPLEGEEAVPVANDLVDLTPHIREDIFLALPQHPVCNPGCHDLPGKSKARVGQPGRDVSPEAGSSAWAALDKLKLD